MKNIRENITYSCILIEFCSILNFQWQYSGGGHKGTKAAVSYTGTSPAFFLEERFWIQENWIFNLSLFLIFFPSIVTIKNAEGFWGTPGSFAWSQRILFLLTLIQPVMLSDFVGAGFSCWTAVRLLEAWAIRMSKLRSKPNIYFIVAVLGSADI